MERWHAESHLLDVLSLRPRAISAVKMQGMMHIVQCALVFYLLKSGACKSMDLRKSSDSSELIRLVARNAEMAHRKIVEPVGVRRQEEIRLVHWRDDFNYIPRQNSIPAKIWMTVPDKANVSTEVQVDKHASVSDPAAHVDHMQSGCPRCSDWGWLGSTPDVICHAGEDRYRPLCKSWIQAHSAR